MHDIPDLDKKGLRNFGLMMGAFLAGLFGLVFPYIGGMAFPLWPWLVAAFFWVWALAAPGTLNPVYRVWMKIGLTIGKVVNMIILGFVFFVIIFPMGIIMRLIGRDPMFRKLDKTTDTYRTPSKTSSPNSLEKPF
jgi:hypothetical protein